MNADAPPFAVRARDQDKASQHVGEGLRSRTGERGDRQNACCVAKRVSRSLPQSACVLLVSRALSRCPNTCNNTPCGQASAVLVPHITQSLKHAPAPPLPKTLASKAGPRPMHPAAASMTAAAAAAAASFAAVHDETVLYVAPVPAESEQDLTALFGQVCIQQAGGPNVVVFLRGVVSVVCVCVVDEAQSASKRCCSSTISRPHPRKKHSLAPFRTCACSPRRRRVRRRDWFVLLHGGTHVCFLHGPARGAPKLMWIVLPMRKTRRQHRKPTHTTHTTQPLSASWTRSRRRRPRRRSTA